MDYSSQTYPAAEYQRALQIREKRHHSRIVRAWLMNYRRHFWGWRKTKTTQCSDLKCLMNEYFFGKLYNNMTMMRYFEVIYGKHKVFLVVFSAYLTQKTTKTPLTIAGKCKHGVSMNITVERRIDTVLLKLHPN